MTQTLRTAESYYEWSARVAARASEEAARAGQAGGSAALAAAALVVAQHQAAAALEAPAAAAAMLLEQGVKRPAEAVLQPLAFVTQVGSIEAMMRSVLVDIASSRPGIPGVPVGANPQSGRRERVGLGDEPLGLSSQITSPGSVGHRADRPLVFSGGRPWGSSSVGGSSSAAGPWGSSSVDDLLATIDRDAEQLLTDWRFDRLVQSLVQDAARDAQQVDVITRPHISHVRHLVLPSCSRCVVLAGRVYKWSMGFQRHPGCDCVMVPTLLADDSLTYDVDQLVRDGKVTGLSKADREALALGANFNQVVNVRRSLAVINVGGRDVQVSREGITRRGLAFKGRTGRRLNERLTPKSILAVSGGDRDEALRLFKLHGYIS